MYANDAMRATQNNIELNGEVVGISESALPLVLPTLPRHKITRFTYKNNIIQHKFQKYTELLCVCVSVVFHRQSIGSFSSSLSQCKNAFSSE